MSKPKPLKLLKIVWFDANSPLEPWSEIGKITSELVRVESIGYLVHETKTAITLAGSVTGEGQAGSILTVPRCNIKKLTRL